MTSFSAWMYVVGGVALSAGWVGLLYAVNRLLRWRRGRSV